MHFTVNVSSLVGRSMALLHWSSHILSLPVVSVLLSTSRAAWLAPSARGTTELAHNYKTKPTISAVPLSFYSEILESFIPKHTSFLPVH